MSESNGPQIEPEGRLDFEAQYQNLVECVNRLESGQISLDDALGAYQNGIAMVQNCRTILGQAQARVEKLTSIDNDGRAQTQPIHLDVETPDSMLGQKKNGVSSSEPF